MKNEVIAGTGDKVMLENAIELKKTLDAIEVKEIVFAIADGQLDGSFNVIQNALRARQDVIDRRKAAELKAGDIVFLQGMSPKYVNGMRAEVIDPWMYGRKGQRKVLVNVPSLAGTRYAQKCKVNPRNLRIPSDVI